MYVYHPVGLKFLADILGQKNWFVILFFLIFFKKFLFFLFTVILLLVTGAWVVCYYRPEFYTDTMPLYSFWNVCCFGHDNSGSWILDIGGTGLTVSSTSRS